MSELDQLVLLIESFYSLSTPPQEQGRIQLQLQSVQSSEKGWDIVQPLLEHHDPNVRFFAAATLELKISQHWSTLNSSSHATLRQSLLGWLALASSRSYPLDRPTISPPEEKIVMRKLTSAVASLSLRLEDWKDWLLEVMLLVENVARQAAVLQVLGIAIEQVARADLVGPRRVQYMSRLSSSIPHVVATLVTSLSSPIASPDEINSSLSCFTAFLIAGQLTHTELDPLYPLLLPHLKREETLIHAASAIEELIERSSGMSGGASVTRFMTRTRTEHLVTEWAATNYVRHTIESAVAEENTTSESMAVIKLLAVLAEHMVTFLFLSVPSSSNATHLRLFSPPISHLFHSLLSITTFPGHSTESYAVNDISSGVWLSLQEECSDNGMVSEFDPVRDDRQGGKEEWDVVQGVFRALADGLRKRAEWPREEIIRGWQKDGFDDFRNYRSTTLAEMIILPYYILRESLLASVVNLASHQILDTSSPSLEPLEATLFTIYCFEEPVDHSPSLSILFTPSFFSQLPSNPATITLRSTALRLVGAYASWFANKPEACLSAVDFVVRGLSEEKALAASAAKALHSLCSSSRTQLVQHCESFVDVLGNLEGKIEDAEFVKVLESVSAVVQALPPSSIVEPILTLATPIITKLVLALSIPPSSPASIVIEAKELLQQQLAYLLALAKGLSDPDGDLADLDASIDDTSFEIERTMGVMSDPRIARLRTDLASVVAGIAAKWSMDLEVTQALFEYIKRSTSDAIPSAISLDPFSLLTVASSTLEVSFSPIWLLLSSHLIARIARDRTDPAKMDEEVERLAGVVEPALRSALGRCMDLAVMNDNPDVVQALVGCCSTIIRHYPTIFTLLPQHLDAVLTFAEQGLGLQENFSLKSIIDLLIITIQQTRMASPSTTVFLAILVPHLPIILSALLTAIAGFVPRSHLNSLSELVHVCLLRLPTQTKAVIRELLATNTAEGVVKGRDGFERALVIARTGKQVRAAVGEFASICRGLSGTAYGAASLSIFD